MKYYKQVWRQSRADDCDSWGKSIWYFAVCSSGITRKQIEIYENGTSLIYSEDALLSDEYGGLAEVPFERDYSQQCEVSKSEFLDLMASLQFSNKVRN